MLRPLRDDEYPVWHDAEIEEYARDISENGDTPPDAARRKAEADMAEILPEGLATPKHWAYVIEVDGERAGRLWLAEREIDGRQVMFIFDIHVDESFRGRGFGRAAMLLAEHESLGHGIHRIELNVFAQPHVHGASSGMPASMPSAPSNLGRTSPGRRSRQSAYRSLAMPTLRSTQPTAS